MPAAQAHAVGAAVAYVSIWVVGPEAERHAFTEVHSPGGGDVHLWGLLIQE